VSEGAEVEEGSGVGVSVGPSTVLWVDVAVEGIEVAVGPGGTLGTEVAVGAGGVG